jgi:hypothetical protein
VTTLSPANELLQAIDLLEPTLCEPEDRPQLLPHQVPPEGKWSLWLLEGGGGSGKTDACARYFAGICASTPAHAGGSSPRPGLYRSAPQRALRDRTPAEADGARIKAQPQGNGHPPARHYRVRHDRVDKGGTVTLRHRSRLRHIAVGRANKAAAWSCYSPIATCACSALRARSCASWCSIPTASISRLASSSVYDVSRHLSPMS